MLIFKRFFFCLLHLLYNVRIYFYTYTLIEQNEFLKEESMDILPEYLIVESLGIFSGNFLYWARRKSDNAIVLIKQSETAHLFDDEIEHLKREYETARLIGCKVSLHLPSAQNGHGAIIYESCEGIFLNRLLETQQLSIDDKIHLFRAAAKALGDLQKKGVMHFGIRLDKTLLRNNNEEIIFFALGDTVILNNDETYIPGNHHYTLDVLKYLPPEMTGKTCKVADLRTSFYQLGIMFYFVFTGKYPFESSDPEKLLYAQAFEKPTEPHIIKKEIPDWISAIIMKLLEKDPEDRYQTASALCFDLEGLKSAANFVPGTNFIPGTKDCGLFKLTKKVFGYKEQLEELDWYCKHISLAETRAVFIKCEDGCGKKEFLEVFNENVNKLGGYYFSTDFSRASGNFPFHGILMLLNQIIAYIKANGKETKFIDFIKKEKDIEPYLHLFAALFPELKNIYPHNAEDKNNSVLINVHFRHCFFYLTASILRFFTDNFGVLTIYISGLNSEMNEELKILRYLLGHCSHLMFLFSVSEDDKDGIEKKLDSDSVFFAEIRLHALSRTDAAQMIAASFHCSSTETLQAADVLIRQSNGHAAVMKHILQNWYNNSVISYSNGKLLFDTNSASMLFVPNFNVTESLLRNKSSLDKSFLQLLSCFPAGVKGIKIRKIMKLESFAFQQILNECKNFITQRCGCIYFQDEEDRHFIYKNLSAGELKYFHTLIVLDFIQSGTADDFSFTMMDHVAIAFDSLNEEQQKILLDLFIYIIEKSNLTAAFEYGFQLCCQVIDLYGNEKLRQHNVECHFYCLAAILGFFSGNYGMMLDLFNHLNTDEYKNDYEKLEIQEFVAEYFQQIGQLDEAIELCTSALENLGFPVPENISELRLLHEQYLLKKKAQSIKDFKKLPEMKKPEHILIMRYLAKIIPIISFLRTKDANFLACKMVNFVFDNGKSFISPFAFALYGSFLFKEQRNFKEGVFWAQTALAMLDDVNAAEFISQTIFFAVFFAGHWKLSHEQIYYWINRAANYENDYGSSNYGVVCNNILPLYSCLSGMHLKQIITDSDYHVSDFFNQDTSNPTVYLQHVSLDVIKNLSLGGERMWTILSEITREPQSGKERFFSNYYYTLELFLSVAEEKPDIILKKCQIEEKTFYPFFAENYLYQAMLLKLAVGSGSVNKKIGIQKIYKILRILKKCKRSGAENLETKFYMISGIIADLKGNFALSNKWYYEALQECLKIGNHLEAAFCSLLLMKEQLHNGDKIIASVYFKKAVDYFNSLGYSGIVNYLKTRYEMQLEDETVLKETNDTNENEIIDSFTKDLNAVSNAVDLVHCFVKQILFLFQTDVFIAVGFDKLKKPLIEAAEYKNRSSEITEGMMLSDISGERLPKYLISFVCENICSVNLNDKKWHNITFYDRYLKEHNPRNAFCIPLFLSKEKNIDNLVMVLYLETSSHREIFSPESEQLIQKLFETYLKCRRKMQASLRKESVHSKKINHLQQKLKDVSGKYKELAGLQSQGILKFDLYGKITYCNSVGCKMLGLETKTLKEGFYVQQLFTPGKDKTGGCADVEKLLKYSFGGPYEYEWCGRCFVRVSWAVLRNESSKITGGRAIFIDITKQKQNEKKLKELNERQEELIAKRTQSLNESLLQLRRSQNQLVQSEKMASLNSVIIGISHEINTPLGIAITSVSTLTESCRKFGDAAANSDIRKEEITKFVDDTQKTLSLISNNLGSIASLINNFKELLREQSKSELCQFDLRYYLNMIYQTQKMRFAHIQYEFILNCPSPFLINSYPGVFFQIISNLMLNSFIHGFEKRDNCIICIIVTMEKDNQIKLIYKDNGRGIPEENLDKIFNPFFTTAVGQGGQGLGLYIVYNLVHERLNGTIQCSSSPGNGTSFTIMFPNSVL